MLGTLMVITYTAGHSVSLTRSEEVAQNETFFQLNEIQVKHKNRHKLSESAPEQESKTQVHEALEKEVSQTMHQLPKQNTSTHHSILRTVERKHQEPIKLPFNSATAKTYRYVLPRAAYFDKRRRGGHENATVILAHMNKTVFERDLIVACIVGGQRAKKFKIQTMKLNEWIHLNHPECTHDNVLIFCYDTPARNNSRVSVVYRNPNNDSEQYETESEHPLFIPYPVNATNNDSSVMVCTTVYETPPYFREWLHYQKTLGVDFIYINAQESFTKSEVFNDTFFRESLDNGLVQLKVWKEYLSKKEVFYHSQVLYYQNCLYRFQGIYKYSIMADTDDFLTPRGSDRMSLRQHLDSLFTLKPKLGSIRLRWVRYYEPICGLNFTGGLLDHDGNLTQYVNITSATREKNFKSIHKVSATVEAKVHEVAELMPGYCWTIVPDDVAYMAHIKRHKLKKDQQQRLCNHTMNTS